MNASVTLVLMRDKLYVMACLRDSVELEAAKASGMQDGVDCMVTLFCCVAEGYES
jgi:hypothetical protein